MEQATPENQGEVAAPSAAASREVEASVKPKRSRRTRWNNDGPTDEVSSLGVLLDWLTTEGSYARWRGGDGHSGETKAALASQIATLIESQGIATGRKAKDVVNKVGQLEQSFREAVDFLSNTGAGITDEVSLRAAVEKRCPHYEVLKGVFGDRPSIRPLLTSDSMSLLGGDDGDTQEHGTDECVDLDDPVETVEPPAKRQRTNCQTRERPRSIRARGPSAASTVSNWSDLNCALSHAKEKDRKIKTRVHTEQLEWERRRFAQTAKLEEQKMNCAEQET